MTKIFSTIASLLISISVFAQEPSLITTKPQVINSYMYEENSQMHYASDVTFNAEVNPNGTNCRVYFEFGPTSDYGTVVEATPFSVSGTETVTVSATALARNGNNQYHCRVFVINENGTYYGQSNHFVSVINYTENLKFKHLCSDDSTLGKIVVTNKNTYPVSVSIGSDINNYVTLNSLQTHTFFGVKNTMEGFYINYSNPENTAVYQQLFCNVKITETDCSTLPTPIDKFDYTFKGIYGNSNASARHIYFENTNDINTEILFISNSGSNQYSINVLRNTPKIFFLTNSEPIGLYYNSVLFLQIFPMDINSPRYSYVTATPISHDGSTASYLIQNNGPLAYDFANNVIDRKVLFRFPAPEHNLGEEAFNPLAVVNLPIYQKSFVSIPEQFYTGMFAEDRIYPIAYSAYISFEWYYMLWTPTEPDKDYTLLTILSPGFSKLETETENFILDAYADTVKTKMLCDINWWASSDQAWLTMFRTGGWGNDTLIFYTQPNTTGIDRVATVTLNSGVNVKTITFTQLAQPGNALNFDGTDDYISIPDNDINITTAFTLETWVKWQPNAPNNVQFICGKAYEQMELHTSGPNNNLRFIPTHGVYIDAPNNLPENQWIHIAAVYNPQEALAKIYINGIEVPVTIGGTNPVTTPVVNTANSFLIGKRYDVYHFKGAIDEFRIWNIALTSEQIQENFNNPLTTYNQPELVGYYNFNQATANADNSTVNYLTDISGNLNGTLNNFALTGNISNWIASYAMVVPTATNETDLTDVSFTATWTAPEIGIYDNYLLYVATDQNFTNTLTGYNPKVLNNNVYSELISGLSSNTNYYYRSQAQNNNFVGEAAFSNTIQVTTKLILNISASVNPVNSGNITGTGNYDYGQTCELTATPQTGYNFVNWTENGTEVSTDATYSFTVTENRLLVANFELQNFDISASVNPVNSGNITGIGNYDYNTTCELTATPQTGYNFVNWTENGTEVSTNATYSFTVTENRVLVANFELQNFDISASVNPVNSGNITGTGNYDYNTTCELTATPQTGYNFVNWTENGTEVSTNATYSFTVTENRVLVANFELQNFDISASVNPVNSGNITGIGNYDYNTTCELVATPQTGYNFVNWTENGSEVSTNATYSFTVTQDSSVVANFTFTSSIAENEYHNIVIHPNPTDNYLYFSNLESEKLMSIKIYNIFGQSVLNFSDFDADKIDVSNLVKGIYFVEIKNENEKITQKMIKK